MRTLFVNTTFLNFIIKNSGQYIKKISSKYQEKFNWLFDNSREQGNYMKAFYKKTIYCETEVCKFRLEENELNLNGHKQKQK